MEVFIANGKRKESEYKWLLTVYTDLIVIGNSFYTFVIKNAWLIITNILASYKLLIC